MTTPKAKFAGLALIAALCAGSILGLTACTGEMPRTGAETPPGEVDFNAGVAAYKQRDYKTAFEKFEPLAEQGYAGAQYNLGNLYRFGKCVPRNEEAAAKWYCHAAKQGQAEALYALEGMITVQQIAAKTIAGMGIQGHRHKFPSLAECRPPG